MCADYRLLLTMQGTLDTFGVVEILQMLGRTRRSGTLHIECPERIIDVHFVHGRIAETRDSTRVDVRHRHRQPTAQALARQRRPAAARPWRSRRRARARWAPCSSGPATSPRAICTRCCRARSRARSSRPSWRPRGTSCSWSTAIPATVDFITIDAHAVLLDISALGGEYCLAVEMLGQSNTVLVRNGDYRTLPRTPLTMGRDEFVVLVQVDGQRTVAEIVTASRLEEITVVNILGKLAEAGVLLVKAERQSRAEDAEELRGPSRQCVGGGQPAPRRPVRRGGWRGVGREALERRRRRARLERHPALGRAACGCARAAGFDNEKGRAALPAARPSVSLTPEALRPPARPRSSQARRQAVTSLDQRFERS